MERTVFCPLSVKQGTEREKERKIERKREKDMTRKWAEGTGSEKVHVKNGERGGKEEERERRRVTKGKKAEGIPQRTDERR
jgi:hypothetical protein